MSHDLESPEAALIREQATQWLVELTAGGPDRRAAFTKWVTQSPRHIEEFLLVSATYKALSDTQSGSAQSIDEIVAEALAAGDPGNVVPLARFTFARDQSDRSPRRSMRLRAMVSSIAVSGAAAVAAWVWFFGLSIPFLGSSYSTALGEQHSVRLQDGSLVHMNASSKLRVNFSSRVRNIVLIDGEAIFKVAHEARPFRVHVGDTITEALGTEFNIDRSVGGGRVSVLEGKVRLTPGADSGAHAPVSTPLNAGEEADILRNGTIAKSANPNVMAAVAWRDRRLVFRDATLTTITQEFSRFSALKIYLADDVSRKVRLTATFDADDTQALVAFLEGSPRLHVEQLGNSYIVRGR